MLASSTSRSRETSAVRQMTILGELLPVCLGGANGCSAADRCRCPVLACLVRHERLGKGGWPSDG